MKLVSFAVTGLFGTVAVVSDFKQDDRLTDLGKLNIAVIALSTVVGIQAQTSEFIKTQASNEDAKKSMENLLGQNQTILRQVARGLEPMADTIGVLSVVRVNISPEYEKELKRLAFTKFAKANHRIYQDSHSTVAFYNNDTYTLEFDQNSFLLRQSKIFEVGLTKVPFRLEFYSSLPKGEECHQLQAPAFEYNWDRTRAAYDFMHRNDHISNRGVIHNIYFSDSHHVMQQTYDTFRLTNLRNSSVSVLDFNGLYVWVRLDYWSAPVNFEIMNMAFQIGHRYAQINANNPIKDACGGYIFQMPRFQ